MRADSELKMSGVRRMYNEPVEKNFSQRIKEYLAVLGFGIGLGISVMWYVFDRKPSFDDVVQVSYVQEEVPEIERKGVWFSKKACIAVSDGLKEVSAIRGEHDYRVETGLIHVISKGRAFVSSRDVEFGIDSLLNSDNFIGKLLRPYDGPSIAPIPSGSAESRFDELLKQHSDWRALVMPLIDDNRDGAYSVEERRRAIYKVFR